MTGNEIAEFMQTPISKLLNLCRDQEAAAAVLSLAIQLGIRQGQRQVCDNYNRAMGNYIFNDVDKYAKYQVAAKEAK